MNIFSDRRPMFGRTNKIVESTCAWLVNHGMRPNQMSLLSIIFGGVTALAFLFTLLAQSPYLMIVAVFGILGRLTCNLLDGIMAVEGGFKTASGAFYNDFPDRISDSLILVACGYAAHVGWLGWACALVAFMTAYIRIFGAASGLPQDYSGPMAKQHRMFTVIAGCFLASIEIIFWGTTFSLVTALTIIFIGGILTCLLRAGRLLGQLEKRG